MTNKTSKKGKKDQVLAYIKTFMTIHQYPPTVREIAEGVGLKSPASTKYYLELLEDEGYITTKQGASRTIHVKGFEYREVYRKQ